MKKLFICLFISLILPIQAIANDTPISSGYITTEDGNLYFQQYGDKDGKPVIVLHGGPGLDSSYLLPQMSKLAQQHNLVTFYDQRGSGKSLGFELNEKSITMQNFVKDLDKVRSALGKDKVIIVGHSWGTLLAMNYAIKYPDNVELLILVSGAPSTSDGFQVFINEYIKRTKPIQTELSAIEKSQAYLSGNPDAVENYFHKIFAFYFYKPEQIAELTLKFTKNDALSGRRVAEIFGEKYLANYDLTEELQKLKMPVLIIHGENDIVPVSTAIKTYKSIPDSKMITIKECDHFPYIEQPNEFFKTTQDFIGGSA